MNYGQSRGGTLFCFRIPLYAWKLRKYDRNFVYCEAALTFTSYSGEVAVQRLLNYFDRLYFRYDISSFVKHSTRILTIHNLSASCILYIRRSFIVIIRIVGLIPLAIFTGRLYPLPFTRGDIHD